MHFFSLKLFMNYLLSYIVIIVIFLLCLTPLYLILVDQIKVNNTSNAISDLNMAVTDINSDMNSIKTMANQLYYQSSYQLISLSNETKNYYNYSDPVNVVKKLDEIAYHPGIVSYVFATFGKNGMLIDNNRLYHTRQQFYDNVLFYPSISFEVWSNKLNRVGEALWPVKTVQLYNGLHSQEFLTYNYYYRQGTSANRLTCLIKKSYFEHSLLPNEIKNTGFLYFVDELGQIYLNTGYEGDLPIDMVKNGESVRVNEKEFIVISKHIDSLQLDAVVGIPILYYNRSLSQVNYAIRIYIIIALLVTVVLSLILTFLKVYPLRKLLGQVGALGINDYTTSNIHKYLSSVFSRMRTAQTAALEELSSITDMLEYSYAEMYIRNGIANAEVLETLSKLFHLSEHNYLLLIDFSSRPGIDNYVLMLTIKTLLKDIYRQSFYIHVTTDNVIVLFLSLLTDSKEELEGLHKQNSLLLNQLPSGCKIVVSTEYSFIEDVSKIFSAARNWILSGFAPAGKITYIKQEDLKSSVVVEMNDLNKLNEYLLAGKADDAVLLIEDIWNEKQLDAQSFTQLFYSLRGTLISVANKVNYPAIDHVCEYDATLSRIFLMDNIKVFALEICDHIDEMRKSHNEQLQQKILKFIDTNYSDSNLCAAMIADKFGISKKYFSNFLKEQTNKTYTEYVEDVRLTKALAMIKETEISITEISYQCGFTSQNTFYKAFKRKYDISPSSLRVKQ